MRGRGGEPWSYVHAKTGCQTKRSAARALQLSALAAHSLALLRWRHQLPKNATPLAKPVQCHSAHRYRFRWWRWTARRTPRPFSTRSVTFSPCRLRSRWCNQPTSSHSAWLSREGHAIASPAGAFSCTLSPWRTSRKAGGLREPTLFPCADTSSREYRSTPANASHDGDGALGDPTASQPTASPVRRSGCLRGIRARLNAFNSGTPHFHRPFSSSLYQALCSP